MNLIPLNLLRKLFLIFCFTFLSTLYSFANSKQIISDSESCLWSTYRPGPYFGLKSLTENSPLFSLLWYSPKDLSKIFKMRHFLEQSDNISKYEWIIHNGCDFGRLVIEDLEMNVKFVVTFSNQIMNNENHWVVNVNGIENSEDSKGIVFLWYISNSNNNSNNKNTKDPINIQNNLVYKGLDYDSSSKILKGNYNGKEFKIFSTQNSENKHPKYNDEIFDNEYYLVMDIDDSRLHDPTEFIKTELKDIVGFKPNHLIDSKDSYRSINVSRGNVFVQQIFLIEQFSFNIHFFDKEIERSKVDEDFVKNLFLMKEKEYNLKFENIYGSSKVIQLSEGIKHSHSNLKLKNEIEKTAKNALSSLLSNIIHMSGNLQILDEETKSVKIANKTELMAIGPDKNSHMRGFMWDEGFQQMILFNWNFDQSMKIIENWFNNADYNTGWIAREISLDNESRSRAPLSSWAALPNVSNPPTLFLYLNYLIDSNLDESKKLSFLNKNIRNINNNANWYLKTQVSLIENVYSWKGKTDDYCLPSGLDDYPRSKLFGKNYVEGHTDLQSWIILLSKTMIRIFSKLDKIKYNDNILFWTEKYNSSKEILLKEFWNPESKKFDDIYYDDKGTKHYSNHTGYIQLFPLILNILNKDNQEEKTFINSIFELMLNEKNNLRTKYGIRSLSNLDISYRKGQNYWTSPIWININYLCVKILNEYKEYSYINEEGNKRDLSIEYEKLRNDLILNIVKNFSENGFIWETYDDITGQGQYNHPFTGWSALIINLIYEKYK